MDNSWDYNEGQSELRMGKALRDGTSSIFDATAQHPEWLGEEPERKQKLMPA